MRRTVLAAFALFALLVPSANAAEPRIAAGVTAAGTEVSGLTLAEAAGKLYNTFGFAVGRPLSTHAAGHKYAINPSDLGFVYDVNKTARRAYNAGLKAHTQTIDVPLFITYDAAKVTEYATKVAADLKRDPRDARVDIKLRSIGKVASKDGRAIDATALAAGVGAALSDPAKDRILTPKVKVVRPKVTTAGLSKAYGT
ncbi:MAG TPA: peptidoglycan binding domain-containing protein, partial [Solirubrobacter sp.]